MISLTSSFDSIPNLERIFINLLNDSGYPGIKIQKKVDFEQLYKNRSN